MKTCPRCQYITDDAAAFCPECGQSIADTVHPHTMIYPTVLCGRCRTPIPSNCLFCPRCGSPVGALPAKPFVPKKGLGITSLVFGILSVLFIWNPFLSLPFSITALITGNRAQKAARAVGSNNSFANVGAGFGRVMCIFWMVFFIAAMVFAIFAMIKMSGTVEKSIWYRQ